MKFLVLFVNTMGRLSFREAEIRAILEMQGLEGAKTRWPRMGQLDDTPFMEIDLPSEDVARDVASRAIGIKGIFEPWGSGATAEDCLESIGTYPEERKAPYLKEESTFKINKGDA
ncbi:hypothetical protein T484DRAFT_1777128 [Baffinella frigidus]|nr:hypothetical protein T484DRAFT_1777128 [Cryptophyta sp. CCMP2293]